ncbi:hypothetical protein Leryth_003096 [Lithospermum erythrorhizon]|nr:hypothetical protein Leryth_003096 [Lithospermum erythrorhizon]
MEESSFVRPLSVRTGGPLKSTLSGRSTPRGSPSFRRLNSVRTPRGYGQIDVFGSQWFRSNRIVLWLLLITLWAYGGFYFQSRWAHGDNKEGIFGGRDDEPSEEVPQIREGKQRDLVANNEPVNLQTKSNTNNLGADLTEKQKGVPSRKPNKGKRAARGSRRKLRGKQTEVEKVEGNDDVQEEEIPKQNTTYGLLVGPFGTIEDRILEWSPEKRSGTCDRKGPFARLVWSRKFVLIFHEMSMTGAPLAMLELATEFLSCGATVSVVALSKKGGLMPELERRKIKVLDERSDLSFKTAMKADLVIAGSAVSASWIEKYLQRTVLGTSQIVWWIMENRREYFDQSKTVLNRVKKLVFLSELQSKQWLAWCEEENITLKSGFALVPLSISDELSFAAGIPSTLNTPSFSPEKMLEKRQLLRESVRKEMGLTDDDMLVITLSSINPGKGQFELLESARLIFKEGLPLTTSGLEDMAGKGEDYHSRTLLQNRKQAGRKSDVFPTRRSSRDLAKDRKTRSRRLTIRAKPDTVINGSGRILQFENVVNKETKLKVLIGSVGSKSNKVPYVKLLLKSLSQSPKLLKSVLWTPATTRVASLYAAADVYVMNSQGLGETFGRVTIEAMAFGLPVLGTDSGGTKEIVEHNVTGLLHPMGHPGAQVLAKNLQYMLKNPSARQLMGSAGRSKVKKMYLKKHMFKKMAEVLYSCMRIK